MRGLSRAPRDRAHRRARPCGARRASARVRPGPGCPRYGRCGRCRRGASGSATICSVRSATTSCTRREAAALLALDGEEGLGQRDRDLGGIERRHRAVAADDLVSRLRDRTCRLCGRRRKSGTGTDATVSMRGETSAQTPFVLGAEAGRIACRKPRRRSRRPQAIHRDTPPEDVHAVAAGLLARGSSLSVRPSRDPAIQ